MPLSLMKTYLLRQPWVLSIPEQICSLGATVKGNALGDQNGMKWVHEAHPHPHAGRIRHNYHNFSHTVRLFMF